MADSLAPHLHAWETIGWNTPGTGPVPMFRAHAWALQLAHDNGARFVVTSADRRKGIAERYGHKSQAQLYADFRAGRGLPANEPGYSSHELRSDGSSFYGARRGAPIPDWKLGIDAVDDGSQNDCTSLLWHLNHIGFRTARIYHTGAEAHHFSFEDDFAQKARRDYIRKHGGARHPKPKPPPKRAPVVRHPATTPRPVSPVTPLAVHARPHILKRPVKIPAPKVHIPKRPFILRGALGIDVFDGDGSIDWGAARRVGVRFAWLQRADGNYTERLFTRGRVAAARHAGVVPGAYIYLEPVPGRSGRTEARWLMAGARAAGLYTQGSGWSLRPCIDVERSSLGRSATLRYIADAVDEIRILNHGRKPVIYAGAYWRDSLNPSTNFGCELWYPSYPTLRLVPRAWPHGPAVHQFTDTGRIAGHSGNLDLNRALVSDLLLHVGQVD